MKDLGVLVLGLIFVQRGPRITVIWRVMRKNVSGRSRAGSQGNNHSTTSSQFAPVREGPRGHGKACIAKKHLGRRREKALSR